MPFPITEHVVKTKRHTTAYLSCGASDAPILSFLHGWPELSISWRHQLPVFAELGFRCVAPDMRGYGRSSVYGQHADYAVENSVRDMIELLDSFGREKAVWVGHDWGSPVVWDIASHHPDRCHGVANLCVPYLPKGFAPENFLPLVDRTLYPESKFPAGQWLPAILSGELPGRVCRLRGQHAQHDEGAIPQGQCGGARSAVSHGHDTSGGGLVWWGGQGARCAAGCRCAD